MSIERARTLRRNPPEPERQLWRILHTLRQAGFHFRRQVQLGPYYADFACLHAQLIVEADGSTHAADGEAYDRSRDSYLHSRGFRILRFWNSDIMSNPDGVFQVVAEALDYVPTPPPTPVPSPQGGGRPRKRKLRDGLAELAARTGGATSGGRNAQVPRRPDEGRVTPDKSGDVDA